MTNLIHLYLDEKTGITQDGLEKLRAWAMVQEDQFRPDYVSPLHPADRKFMDSSQTTAAWHFPIFLALTFGAMVVWPVLGIAASSLLFDRISEAVLFLGGITALLPLPVYIILPQSEMWNCHYHSLGSCLDWRFSMVHVWLAYTSCTGHRPGRTVRHLAGSVGSCFPDDSRQEHIDHAGSTAG